VDDGPDDATSTTASGAAPTAPEVRAQLEKILASRCFEQAQRASRFLRYAVEQTLAGHGERLKGYTIAVEAFDRAPDFDAQSDPLVRVEAGRLRRRLIEYYATEGQDDLVRIELPRGGYSVAWTYAPRSDRNDAPAGVSAMGAPAAAQTRSRRRWRRIRTLIFASVVLIAFAIIVLQQREFSRRSPPTAPTLAEAVAQGRPPIVVLPFEDLTGDPRAQSLAQTLTEEVLVKLDEHDFFAIAAEPRKDVVDPTVVTVAAVHSPGPGYVLSGSVRYTPDGVRITARLVLASEGTQLWGDAYDAPLSIETASAEQETIARDIAAVAAPYGRVFEAELGRTAGAPRPSEPSSTVDCMLEYYAYRLDFAPALHARALDCFERLTSGGSRLADAWAGLALVYVDAYAYGFEVDAGDALAEAREAARTAMDIDGGRLFANLALARVQFFSRSDFRPTAEQALALRPNNAEALALVGTMFALSGDVVRGQEMIDRAIALSPKAPGNYFAGKALAHIGAHEYDAALAAALRIDAPNWVMGHMIVASAAALAGRTDIAARESLRIGELRASAGQDTSAAVQRWPIDEALREEFRSGLAAASVAATR
jgi:adenylate cyclase